MKIRSLISSVLLSVLFVSFSVGQEQALVSVIKKGAVLEKLAGGFAFTEGPAPDADGNVFFTDQPNDRIMRWGTDGKLTTFMQPCGRSNGMFFDRQGYLWACADEKNEIWKISMTKDVEVVAGLFDKQPYNGPNDLFISPSGGIYFTDPFYKRPWWDHSDMPQKIQCVYYLLPDRSKVIKVADDLEKPNGIIGTADGKILYVSDIGGKKTWRYMINPDGSLTEKTLFCDMGSDGMTIDIKGNVYLTGSAVTVFDRTGKKLGNIPVPEKWTANVCFGDKDRKSLYITASTGLYRIRTSVKGAF
jgi:gluconolactonase